MRPRTGAYATACRFPRTTAEKNLDQGFLYSGAMSASAPISFARGAPSADILPVGAIRAAAERALGDGWETALSYGTGAGHPGLREWIASYQGVEPDQVLVTNGSMQADVFLFQHVLEPGDAAVVESPSYDRTLLMLRRLGAELVAIPLEPDGIDAGALERALGAGLAPKLAHIIPNFHNPAGCTLSLEKRRRLGELAGEHGFLIFEDDPYIELRFEGEPLPTMLSLDGGAGRVVYASSFSKTVSPGVRVGYLVGPAETIAAIAELATGTYISPSMLAQAVVWEFCRSGAFRESIETVREALRERRDALCEALREHLPQAELAVPEGGYFLWLTLPEVDCDALFAVAREEGVLVVKGSDFVLQGGRNNLRLAYSGVTTGEIGEGVARLARAVEKLHTVATA